MAPPVASSALNCLTVATVAVQRCACRRLAALATRSITHASARATTRAAATGLGGGVRTGGDGGRSRDGPCHHGLLSRGRTRSNSLHGLRACAFYQRSWHLPGEGREARR